MEQMVDNNQNYDSLSDEPMHRLKCLESRDCSEYSSVMSYLNTERIKSTYNPSIESREEHNRKERCRRSRIKCSTDALRALVPGLNDKTDKASVLEHTVHFLFHLSNCAGVQCIVLNNSIIYLFNKLNDFIIFRIISQYFHRR